MRGKPFDAGGRATPLLLEFLSLETKYMKHIANNVAAYKPTENMFF